jgi:MFS family permease
MLDLYLTIYLSKQEEAKMNEEAKVGYRLILSQKEYMKTVTAAVINRFGDSIDSIAMVWLVYQITQSAAWSAIIFGVNRIPTIFLQPFAGAMIEGRNKKRIMVITDLIRGVCVGLIASAHLLGFLNQWILLTATVAISCAEAFRGPASSAILPKLLKKEYFSFGMSLNSSLCSVMELIGLGAAGIIISVFDVTAAIYVDMATFFLSALIIATLRVKEENLVRGRINAKEYMNNLKGGFVYLSSNTVLRQFMLLAVFMNAVLVPLNSLQAPLVSEVLKVGEIMLSVLGIAIAVGMAAGAALYPYLSRRLSKRTIASLGGYSIGFYYFVFVAVGSLPLPEIWIYVIVFLVSFAVGVVIAIFVSFCNVEFMKHIQGDYIARASSIFSATCVASIPVASFVVSILAGFTPTVVLFLIAGILDVIICIGLCSRKRFSAMEMSETEVIEHGEEITDSTAC